MTSAEGEKTINIDLCGWIIEPACNLEGIYECMLAIQERHLQNTIDEGIKGEKYKEFLAAFHFLREAVRREQEALDKLLDDGINVEV